MIGFFRTFANSMKKQRFMTHKEATKKALEELGGRARLKDIYPRVIPHIQYKAGSNIQATLRRLLQTTPELFRPVEGMRGWWELVSYQEELAARDRKIEELNKSHISKEEIIQSFNDFDTMGERLDAKRMMQQMFPSNTAWRSAYLEMRKAGYFREERPQIIIINPQFGTSYIIKGNQTVKIGNDMNIFGDNHGIVYGDNATHTGNNYYDGQKMQADNGEDPYESLLLQIIEPLRESHNWKAILQPYCAAVVEGVLPKWPHALFIRKTGIEVPAASYSDWTRRDRFSQEELEPFVEKFLHLKRQIDNFN